MQLLNKAIFLTRTACIWDMDYLILSSLIMRVRGSYTQLQNLNTVAVRCKL